MPAEEMLPPWLWGCPPQGQSWWQGLFAHMPPLVVTDCPCLGSFPAPLRRREQPLSHPINTDAELNLHVALGSASHPAAKKSEF